MQDPLSFSYAFIEPLNKKIYKKLTNYHIDINKCRKNILYYSEYDYPVFTVMDSPVIYNKDIHNLPGIYYIESKNYFPLRCNGWYYLPMVEYCLENNIITHDNIKYTIQAQLMVKCDYYNDFIDKCYNELPEDLVKLSINSMIGNFKPNVDKHVFTTSVCITTDSREAMYQNIKNNSTFIKHFDVNEKDFYHVFKDVCNIKMETEAPIYEQIVQIENIKLHK